MDQRATYRGLGRHVRLKWIVGPYVRGERHDFGDPTLGVGYGYGNPADSGRVRLNAYVYTRLPDARGLPTAAVLSRQVATYRQALAIEQSRGLMDAYTVALEGTDSVVVPAVAGHAAQVAPGYTLTVALRSRGVVFLSYYLVYAVRDGFVKIRGTVPEAGWEQRPIRAFAHGLVAQALGPASRDRTIDRASARAATDGTRPLGPEEIIHAAAAAPDGVPGEFELSVRGSGRADGRLYLNSERDYRDPRCLTLEVDPAVEAGLRARLGADLPGALAGQRVRVAGVARRVMIRVFADGRPTDRVYYQTHVRVDTPDAIRVVAADTP